MNQIPKLRFFSWFRHPANSGDFQMNRKGLEHFWNWFFPLAFIQRRVRLINLSWHNGIPLQSPHTLEMRFSIFIVSISWKYFTGMDYTTFEASLPCVTVDEGGKSIDVIETFVRNNLFPPSIVRSNSISVSIKSL